MRYNWWYMSSIGKRLTAIVISVAALFISLPSSLASTQPSLQLVGNVPDVGQAKDVDIDADSHLAYVASMQFGLSIVDISNRDRPAVITSANPGFYGDHVSADGSLAAVTSGGLGLTIIDVSNPRAQSPRILGHLDGTFRNVAVVGNTAYALQTIPGNPPHTDLAIVDLSQPANLNIIGRKTVGASDFTGLRVIGSTAYVVAGNTGLRIIDVSDPASPRIVGTAPISTQAQDIDVVNGYAYVAANTNMTIIDVHNASQPFVVKSFPVPATNIIVTNGKAYLLGGYQLSIIDVSTPSAPRLLSSTSSFGAQGLDVVGATLYTASPEVNTTPSPTSKGGLYLIDVSDATIPRVLTNVYNGFGSTGIASNGRISITTGGSWGMRVADVSSANAPAIVRQTAGTFGSVSMSGSFAYVIQTMPGNPAHTDVAVLDLTVPSQAAVIGRVTTLNGYASDVKAVGSVVYVAAGNGGLQVVDIGNPTLPRIIGSTATPAAAVAVGVGTGYAYVGTGTSIQVIDIHTPTHPFIVGSIATSASQLATANQMVYALDGRQLKIIDVATPTNPVQVGSLSGVTAQGIDVSGTLVILATPAVNHTDPNGGVSLVDVSDPTAPILVDKLGVSGSTRAIAIASNLVYAGDSASTINIFTIDSQPPPPTTSSISGTLRYAGPSGNTMSGTIPGVTIRLLNTSGASVASATTDGTGSYTFSNIPLGTYAAQAGKNSESIGDTFDINDALAVLYITVGKLVPSIFQQQACDTSGDRAIDIDDALNLLRATTGNSQTGSVGQWRIETQGSNSISLTATPYPLNFSGTLVGDCDGSWRN